MVRNEYNVVSVLYERRTSTLTSQSAVPSVSSAWLPLPSLYSDNILKANTDQLRTVVTEVHVMSKLSHMLHFMHKMDS